MKKKSTSINLQSEAKIIKGLNYLRNNFSKSIGQPWDSEALYKEVSITRTFATILKNMGIIEYPKKGHILLTEKIDTITPREIHKQINAYQNASQKRNKKIKDKIKAQELAKIQAQIRFENKRKLRGTNNDNGYQEALRNAVPPPSNSNAAYMNFFERLNKLNAQSNVANQAAQTQNLFDIEGAYYPDMNDGIGIKQLLDSIDSILPRNFKIEDMLKGLKAALREELKEELRKEIINELLSKG